MGVAEGVLVHPYEFVRVCTVLACTHVLGLCGRAWVCKCVLVQTYTYTDVQHVMWLECVVSNCVHWLCFVCVRLLYK